MTFGGITVSYTPTALASTSIYTFPSTLRSTVAFTGPSTKAQDAAITALAASAMYGPAATGPTVCGAGNASTIVLALEGFDATTSNTTEIKSSAELLRERTLLGTFTTANFTRSPIGTFKWNQLSWPSGARFTHYLWQPSTYTVPSEHHFWIGHNSCPPILGI